MSAVASSADRDGDLSDAVAQPALGAALRRVRTERGLSLGEVAEATGISASFLSAVENGRSDMTMGRVMRLLKYYGIRIGDLLPSLAPADRVVTTARDRRVLAPPGAGIEMYLLAPDTDRTMMPVLAFHPPGSVVKDLAGHSGEVFVHMLEGSLLFERAGHDPFVLRADQSAYFPGSPPPTVTNLSDEKAVLIATISPPSL